MRETDVFLKGYHYVICIRSFLQEIRFLSLSYWWSCLLCSHWNHLFLSSSFHVHLCYELNEFLIFWFLRFVFSLDLFDGLIIPSLVRFVNTFLNFFFNIFAILRFMCTYFIIYLYFLLFSVNSFFISLQTVFCGL